MPGAAGETQSHLSPNLAPIRKAIHSSSTIRRTDGSPVSASPAVGPAAELGEGDDLAEEVDRYRKTAEEKEGDAPEAVAEPVVINPDPRLRRLARQRGWL